MSILDLASCLLHAPSGKCFEGSWDVVEGMEKMFEGLRLRSLWCVMQMGWIIGIFYGLVLSVYWRCADSGAGCLKPAGCKEKWSLATGESLGRSDLCPDRASRCLGSSYSWGFDRWVGVDCRLRLWPCFDLTYIYIHSFTTLYNSPSLHAMLSRDRY